jgi:hypothetical protein
LPKCPTFKVWINPSGDKLMKKLILHFLFLMIAWAFFSFQVGGQEMLVPFKKGELWGFANRSGKIIIPPKYTDVKHFDSNGLARVERNGYFGKIDSTGNEIIPCIFSRPIYKIRLFQNKAFCNIR